MKIDKKCIKDFVTPDILSVVGPIYHMARYKQYLDEHEEARERFENYKTKMMKMKEES